MRGGVGGGARVDAIVLEQNGPFPTAFSAETLSLGSRELSEVDVNTLHTHCTCSWSGDGGLPLYTESHWLQWRSCDPRKTSHD